MNFCTKQRKFWTHICLFETKLVPLSNYPWWFLSTNSNTNNLALFHYQKFIEKVKKRKRKKRREQLLKELPIQSKSFYTFKPKPITTYNTIGGWACRYKRISERKFPREKNQKNILCSGAYVSTSLHPKIAILCCNKGKKPLHINIRAFRSGSGAAEFWRTV